jgi:hypothetical protein
MKTDTDTNLKPAGDDTPRDSELGGDQPPAAEGVMAGFLPVSRVEAVLASLADKMEKAAVESAHHKRLRDQDLANTYMGVKWGLGVACDELRAELGGAPGRQPGGVQP